MLAQQRDLKKFSVTMGLRGDRENFLLATKKWSIDPNQETFAILGTRSHSLFDNSIKTEIKLNYKDVYGTIDEYEEETQTIIDHKTWGSFRVAQILGIKTEKRSTQIGYYKNGKPQKKQFLIISK